MKQNQRLKNTMKTLAIVLVLANSLNAEAATIREIIGKQSCSGQSLHSEPQTQVPYLAESNWKSILATKSGAIAPTAADDFGNFDPATTGDLYAQARINRAGVSTSHVANAVMVGIQKLRQMESDLIKSKKIQPIINGVTYTESDMAARRDTMKVARQTYFAPMLEKLYDSYIDAVKRDEALSKQKASAQLSQAFYAVATQQREILNNALKARLPSLIAKIGEIAPVVQGQDLPFSYRNGYIVKIRFKKPKDATSVTLYPRTLLTQLTSSDTYFLAALERWTEYTTSQWQIARAAKSGTMSKYQEYLSSALDGEKSIAGVKKSIARVDALQANAVYVEKAYKKSVSDLAGARLIHARLTSLNEQEIYSLVDLFKALRFGDVPQCGETIKDLNDRMLQDMDPKTRSTAKLTGERRIKADSLARDVVFYQDIYQAFSGAAAHALSERNADKALN